MHGHDSRGGPLESTRSVLSGYLNTAGTFFFFWPKISILYLLHAELHCIDRDVTTFTLYRADIFISSSNHEAVLFFECTVVIEVTIRACTSLHLCSNDATLSLQLTHMHTVISVSIKVKGNRRCLHAQC